MLPNQRDPPGDTRMLRSSHQSSEAPTLTTSRHLSAAVRALGSIKPPRWRQHLHARREDRDRGYDARIAEGVHRSRGPQHQGTIHVFRWHRCEVPLVGDVAQAPRREHSHDCFSGLFPAMTAQSLRNHVDHSDRTAAYENIACFYISVHTCGLGDVHGGR